MNQYISLQKNIKKVVISYIIILLSKLNMTARTLHTLVETIQVSRIRLSCMPLGQITNTNWTKEQQGLFIKLIMEYGTDLSLIQSFFPNRSRNQIKRKYKDISEIRRKAVIRQQQKRIRENRKSYFDDQILEQRLMKWRSKPNKSGSSNSNIQI